MLFKEFVNLIYPCISDGRPIEKFTRALFANIVEYDENETNPIIEQTDHSFSAYASGVNNISRLAKKIVARIDPTIFQEFLNHYSDATSASLADAFRNSIPDIFASNANEKVASLFERIIREAAGASRPTSLLANASEEGTPIESRFYNLLYLESKGVCPNTGCTNLLYVSGEGEAVAPQFNIVMIDRDEEKEFKNYIALCPDCSIKYGLNYSEEAKNRMKRIKQLLLKKTEFEKWSSREKIEDGVTTVLQKLQNLKTEPTPLNYNSMDLKMKFLPENYSLYLSVKGFVSEFFTFIDDTFQNLAKERKLRFNSFCYQVKHCYFHFQEQGFSQPEVFSHLTQWLKSHTNEPELYCSIVIAYFIQLCEIFGKIGEGNDSSK